MKNIISYPGGKYFAVKTLAPLIPKDITEYREPFCGGASVFFYMRNNGLAQFYWINDLYPALINFYSEVKSNGNDLSERLLKIKSQGESVAREWFKSKDCSTDAAAFFLRNRCSFSGTTEAGGFSKAKYNDRFTISSINKIKEAQKFLQGVNISNMDYEPVINFRGNKVFLFLDPPYYTAEKLYGKSGELHNFDHERLSRLLQKTNHRFMLTYDDCPEIRKLYDWANKTPYLLQYGMNNCNSEKKSKIGEELIIRNYY